MSNESQVKTLKEVLELEKFLITAERTLFELRSQSYSEPPAPPVLQTVTRTQPEIKSTVVFNKALAFIPCLFFLPWIAIYYFCMYKPEKDKDIERIRNSEEYKAECARFEANYDAQQKEYDQQYAVEKEKYDTETLPNYNSELDAWTKQHDADISTLTEDIKIANERLHSIYESTKIVPMQYRTIDALEYIYNLVSTSDYDVTYAISNYDSYRQRELEQARLAEQQLANELADEQAALLAEQNEIADRARRDARIAGAVNMVQQHNRNKALKDLGRK